MNSLFETIAFGKGYDDGIGGKPKNNPYDPKTQNAEYRLYNTGYDMGKTLHGLTIQEITK